MLEQQEEQEQEQKQVNFEDTHLPIPELILKYPYEKQLEIYNYLKNMDERSKQAYIIAKDHLGTSFNIYKSNGYKDWKKNKL
jgi:hypothetical protein